VLEEKLRGFWIQQNKKVSLHMTFSVGGIVGRGLRPQNPQTSHCVIYLRGDFCKEVHSKNTRMLEVLKRNTEQVVAGNVQPILQIFSRYSVKWVNDLLEKSGEHFLRIL
jgi:hypothetical protein